MNIYDINVEAVTGEEVKLDNLKGKVLLIVNIASKCGYTPQLEGLEKLYKQYKDQGFEVLGFPSNQFMKQAPGTNKELAEFCLMNYGVSFKLFGKLDVKGKKQSELYKYLTENSPVKQGKKVKWNFEKFLINKDGEIAGRYMPGVKPIELTEDIEALI